VSARVSRLHSDTKHDTSYCIEHWMRDEQVRVATKIVPGRIKGWDDEIEDPKQRRPPREEPIAVVGFGPSLKKTWEAIRDFKYVITSSGAHKFLIEKGIIPTWHVEVDPRAHKVELLGPPHPDVIYVPASTCHPAYFGHLLKAGARVDLWHVFSTEEEACRVLPQDEWAILGGADVGLRAAALARFFGFVNHHYFGMDGCAEDATTTHASPHPNAPKKVLPCEWPKGSGKDYMTTIALLECAKMWGHELDQMPDVKPIFHGEGLVQAMWKGYVPKQPTKEEIGTRLIAVRKPRLFSKEYAELNSKLHWDNLTYGVGGAKYGEVVMKLRIETKSDSILDYGCGKSYLAKSLPFPIWEYDPAVESKSEAPRRADIVTCLDVLEHIEPEFLDHVIDDLARLTKRVGYFVIHTGPAGKTLPDGRNTHLIQQGKPWWDEKLGRRFVVAKCFESGPLLHYVVGPKRLKRVTAEQIVDAAKTLTT
jgi:hypothetical protein